ncbi:9283_t:CDS:2, partial [Funneliformis geosporum]
KLFPSVLKTILVHNMKMKLPCINPELNQLEGDLKDIYIKILSPLSLEDDDNDRKFLVERLLTITPQPDVVSGEEANRDDLGGDDGLVYQVKSCLWKSPFELTRILKVDYKEVTIGDSN